MKTHASITYKDIVNLLKIEIDMIMMVSVLLFMFFTFLSLLGRGSYIFLTEVQLLFHMLGKILALPRRSSSTWSSSSISDNLT